MKVIKCTDAIIHFFKQSYFIVVYLTRAGPGALCHIGHIVNIVNTGHMCHIGHKIDSLLELLLDWVGRFEFSLQKVLEKSNTFLSRFDTFLREPITKLARPPGALLAGLTQ